jgi:hypothetical protein
MKHLIWIYFTLLCLPMMAQDHAASPSMAKGQLVKVSDWNSRGIFILESFFEETKDDLVAQIGIEEFEVLKMKCSSSAWPSEMDAGFELTEEQEAAFYEHLNTLEMYRIATYVHKFKGRVFEKTAVLRVPYEGNESWSEGVVWEGNVYFILNDAAVYLAD